MEGTTWDEVRILHSKSKIKVEKVQGNLFTSPNLNVSRTYGSHGIWCNAAVRGWMDVLNFANMRRWKTLLKGFPKGSNLLVCSPCVIYFKTHQILPVLNYNFKSTKCLKSLPVGTTQVWRDELTKYYSKGLYENCQYLTLSYYHHLASAIGGWDGPRLYICNKHLWFPMHYDIMIRTHYHVSSDMISLLPSAYLGFEFKVCHLISYSLDDGRYMEHSVVL
jgi:hypothetical protein